MVALAIDEETRRSAGSGGASGFRLRQHLVAIPPALELVAQAPGIDPHGGGERGQGVLVQHALVLEQRIVHLPELALGASGLGGFRQRLGERVQV